MDKPKSGEKDSEVLYRVTLQANGLACTICGVDFRSGRIARVQVGTSDKGAKVYACKAHAEKKEDIAR